MTAYPDDNPKTTHGALKIDLSLVPPSAIIAEARVMALGAKKYGPYNWREKTVSSRVYTAAAMRHILTWQDGEDTDPESGESHLAHARACLGILLDAKSIGKLNDNRPAAGAAGRLLTPEKLQWTSYEDTFPDERRPISPGPVTYFDPSKPIPERVNYAEHWCATPRAVAPGFSFNCESCRNAITDGPVG